MSTPARKIREAIQALLDAEGDGWTVTEFVIVMGIERFDAAGNIEADDWTWSPTEQPDWKNAGLLTTAFDKRYQTDHED